MSVSRVSNATAATAVAGLHMVTPTSVVVGSGTGSVSGQGAITVSGVTSVTINGCFSSLYSNYRLVYDLAGITGGDIQMRMSNAGTSTSGGTDYVYSHAYMTGTTLANNGGSTGTSSMVSIYSTANIAGTQGSFDIISPNLARYTSVFGVGQYASLADIQFGVHRVSTSYDGFSLTHTSANSITGTFRIYGYNNGGA